MLALILTAYATLAPLTAYTAADVARCESNPWPRDGVAVLETARTRARVWGRPLLAVLRQPWQFARGCPTTPRTWQWWHAEAFFGRRM